MTFCLQMLNYIIKLNKNIYKISMHINKQYSLNCTINCLNYKIHVTQRCLNMKYKYLKYL